MTEAQRFPDDYDGVVVGAPASPITRLNAWQIWPSVLISQDPARAIPQSKSAMVNQAILNKCDALDGLKTAFWRIPRVARRSHSTVNMALSPNLKPFFDRGGSY